MRFLVALCALGALASIGEARMVASKDVFGTNGGVSVTWERTALYSTQQVPVEPPAEAIMTRKTKVFLDGAASELSKIPPSAEVTKMELDSDGKTILRIEFRTVK